ncbi:uncharacterized protein LOC126836781 isoform X2 [Adelges cooleyi]|uniref:uncharacterized protein LOC126836781 isoform X2 n=1 Tax=Adelges cooleyi TaxID=133065 RepID=UPI00217FC86C|nr:uncharacterized protein LOC126836781 isoform X2 [Adelges cooleyi]
MNIMISIEQFVALALVWQVCGSSPTDGDLDQCSPKLADSCFKKLSAALNCHNTDDCVDPPTLCFLFDDSLNCSADIIDGDCSKSNGIERFDSWLSGLRAVYAYTCRKDPDGNYNHTSSVFNNECWNRKQFVSCVGETLNIHHVVDLLNTAFDYKKCVRTIISMSTCNAISHSTMCSKFHDAFLNDLISIFFLQHKCNFEEVKSGAESSRTPQLAVYYVALAAVITLSGFIHNNVKY